MLTENQESLDATISRLTQTQDASCSLSAVLEPQLSDDEWAHIVVNLGGRLGARARGHKSSARCFVEAVLWMAGSNDAYWRCLPIEYGANHSVYVRFSRWVKAGQWDPVLACLPESDARRQGLARMVATHRASLQRKQRYANHQAAGFGRSRVIGWNACSTRAQPRRCMAGACARHALNAVRGSRRPLRP